MRDIERSRIRRGREDGCLLDDIRGEVTYVENMSGCLIGLSQLRIAICDQRLKITRHSVRSAVYKLQIARPVLRWVTMREYLMLQVLLDLYIYGPPQLIIWIPYHQSMYLNIV